MKKREIIRLERCLKAGKEAKIRIKILPLKFDPKSGQKKLKKSHVLSICSRGAILPESSHSAGIRKFALEIAQGPSVFASEQVIFDVKRKESKFLTA
ncbi:hypothetical protein ACS5PU_16225 [Pedobacter sp. GSP4]|uniref:hypothetical protein n=1 Tax=Pedobacter sp. GSP4 TaxID=3453716 RepID=UPI003EEB3AD5